eukprot:3605737-Amphidinium_carterae.2
MSGDPLAQLFQKVVVVESLVRVVSRAEAGKPALSLLCDKALEVMNGLASFDSLDQTSPRVDVELFEVACTELTFLVRFLRMLLGNEAPQVDVLDQMTHASQGVSLTLKNSWQQQAFYRNAEKKARELSVATAAYTPEVQAAEAKIAAEELSLEYVLTTAKRIPVWREGLIAGTFPTSLHVDRKKGFLQ